ncbi:MAG: Ig-like domain-containing protein, partial [Chloroflexota bacterium]|nr:Ig-like domain-containing protein [Chloroflexota bacterium]
GDTVTVQVGVTDGEGRPLPLATVVLFSPASFGDTGGEMRLGQVTTNAAGKASFSYQVRRQGEQVLIGRFAGTSGHAPAETSVNLTVQGSAQLYQEEAEIEVPGIGIWLSLLLGAFWSVFLVAVVLVHLIAREGRKTSSASGGSYG